MGSRRVGAMGTAVLVAAAALAGCGTSSESPAASASGSAAASATGSVTAPASSTATASSTPTASSTAGGVGGSGATGTTGSTPPAVSTSSARSASGPGLCTPTVTRMAAGPSNGGLGHFSVVIVVTNASSSPCVTTGFPGVAQLDASGRQLQQAQRTPSGYMGGLMNGRPAPQLVLQPGEQASAMLEGLNGNPSGAGCASSPAILFTLPDNTDSTTLTTTTQVCQDLQVHPLVPGDTGTVPA